jgi:hypothetical protein
MLKKLILIFAAVLVCAGMTRMAPSAPSRLPSLQPLHCRTPEKPLSNRMAAMAPTAKLPPGKGQNS